MKAACVGCKGVWLEVGLVKAVFVVQQGCKGVQVRLSEGRVRGSDDASEGSAALSASSDER